MTDLELAAYLDRGLDDADRSRVENHLAACADCRTHAATARNVMSEADRPRRLLRLWISATLAAAAVVAFIVVNPTSMRREDTPMLTRSEGTTRSLTAYAPIGDVTRARLQITWGAARAGAAYHLTVADESGARLWSVSTKDTTAALPDSVPLLTDTRYFWTVDAISTDGNTSSTGVKEFNVTR